MQMCNIDDGDEFKWYINKQRSVFKEKSKGSHIYQSIVFNL